MRCCIIGKDVTWHIIQNKVTKKERTRPRMQWLTLRTILLLTYLSRFLSSVQLEQNIRLVGDRECKYPTNMPRIKPETIMLISFTCDRGTGWVLLSILSCGPLKKLYLLSSMMEMDGKGKCAVAVTFSLSFCYACVPCTILCQRKFEILTSAGEEHTIFLLPNFKLDTALNSRCAWMTR